MVTEYSTIRPYKTVTLFCFPPKLTRSGSLGNESFEGGAVDW